MNIRDIVGIWCDKSGSFIWLYSPYINSHRFARCSYTDAYLAADGEDKGAPFLDQLPPPAILAELEADLIYPLKKVRDYLTLSLLTLVTNLILTL